MIFNSQHARAFLRLASSVRKPYRVGAHRRLLSVGTVRITAVDTLTLGEVTHDQARLLGHRGTAALKRAWLADHDRDWLDEADRTDAQQLERYTYRWGHRSAVLIRYVGVDPPRLLADVRRGQGDYTSSPGRTIDTDAEAVPAGAAVALRAAATRENFRAALEAQRALEKAQRGRDQRRAA